ncbi:conserved hypothetical protein [Arthrobacter sp. 9V]|uniref:hypothetical protein n=1 Tax=Arthrobacter sp. 9V TaxID=2653132 RepID=UPI0012F2B49D|nr:hypothetical protein [Arthrobacter sp. 9V]VXC65882.1 conserved hypothetical protein [Arthrobacter sp. 9V]
MTLNHGRGRTTSGKPEFVLPSERPYYYAWGGDNRMYAYTRGEWGLGGSLPSGGNYTVRSGTVQFILAIIMIPAAVLSLVVLIAAVVSLNWIVMIFGLVCTALFAAAPYIGFKAARNEWKARKARRLKGLPKPRTSVGDDEARQYFFDHPEAGPEITPENFPDAKW